MGRKEQSPPFSPIPTNLPGFSTLAALTPAGQSPGCMAVGMTQGKYWKEALGVGKLQRSLCWGWACRGGLVKNLLHPVKAQHIATLDPSGHLPEGFMESP